MNSLIVTLVKVWLLIILTVPFVFALFMLWVIYDVTVYYP